MKNQPLKIAACCLAGTLFTTLPAYNVMAAPSAGISQYASTIVKSELNTSSTTAGVSSAVADYLEKNLVSQNKNAAEASDADAKKDTKNSAKNNSKKEKVQVENKKTSVDDINYDKMAVAQVNDYVNIRKKPNENSEQLGKLYSNSVATVIRKKGDWYKVKSGSVIGYVKSDFVVVGDEDLVKSVGVQIAKVNTTTLKVRSKASQKSEVLTLVPDGEELEVASMKAYKDGWVKVTVDDGKGFVSSDYVDITREYTYAESRAEEEARLAIEEQARLEEEARRAQEEAANNSSSAGTSNQSSSSTGSGSSSSTGTGSASSGTESSTSTSSSSGSGQSVVNYASQFLGYPYVYGGSSLTGGTDCSGFVMSVYAHFGVSLPHSSSALRSAGYGVSYDSMQPGDILCYDGHVAIYAGGNTVIHASNPADGIKYTSPANYRPVVAVRRIF